MDGDRPSLASSTDSIKKETRSVPIKKSIGDPVGDRNRLTFVEFKRTLELLEIPLGDSVRAINELTRAALSLCY